MNQTKHTFIQISSALEDMTKLLIRYLEIFFETHLEAAVNY